jgi:hypothetical protein
MDNFGKTIDPICPLCYSTKSKNYFYPPTTFNGKIFQYKECLECSCSFVHPLPVKDDFDVIYGENDHAYLKKLGENEKHVHQFDYPLYNHQGYQIDFFKKGEYWKKAKTLLDVGCGSGFYMSHAKKNRIRCDRNRIQQGFYGIIKKENRSGYFFIYRF